MEEGKRVAQSLRLCAKVPIKCDGCVETFTVGCATRLRERAADVIEELIASAETLEERDALLEDVKQSCGCKACAHIGKPGTELPCSECRNLDKWQYRRPRDKEC